MTEPRQEQAPAQRTYAPGTPSWIDVSSPDVDASARFYSGLFGWECLEPDTDEDTGGYRMFQLDGVEVAGVGPLPAGSPAPPSWTTYMTVDSADATVERVKARGGDVLMGPIDIAGAGRMAVLADPAGAVFAIWQAVGHTGAQKVNEPGSFSWAELATRDTDAASEFYGGVFGWEPVPAGGEGPPYTQWSLGGKAIGGMIEMGDRYPPDLPPHWLVYIAVEDADATAERAVSLGGKVLVPAIDTPFGRLVVLSDAYGAAFAVIMLTEATSS